VQFSSFKWRSINPHRDFWWVSKWKGGPTIRNGEIWKWNVGKIFGGFQDFFVPTFHPKFEVDSVDPYQRTPFSKVPIELLDTEVFSGSVSRGSDRWRFLGNIPTPAKTNMTMENPPFKDVFRLNMWIFQCHVSFQGCISKHFFLVGCLWDAFPHLFTPKKHIFFGHSLRNQGNRWIR